MTGHRARTLASIVVAALVLAGAAGARAGTSHLDGLTLIELETTDMASMHAARAFVQENGGRVGVMVPPSTLIGWVDPSTADRLLGRHGIRDVRWTETALDQLPNRDEQTISAVQSFNEIVSGRYEQRQFEELAAGGAAGTRMLSEQLRAPDALSHPPIDRAEILSNLKGVGLDASTGPLASGHSPVLSSSDRMTGTVAVTFFLVESDGTGADPNAYTWTPEAMQDYMDATIVGLLWWTDRANLHRDCWVTFVINHYSAYDSRCRQWVEPVLHNSDFISTWAANVLTKFGYVGGNHFSKAAAFNTWQTATYQTNWAYCAFICYNPPAAPGMFANGGYAFAWIYGPYFWSLFRTPGFTRDQPISHESGHIFGACDEYTGGCTDCTSSCSIYGTPNANCEACNPASHACMMRTNENGLCQYTKGMIGWDALTPCAPSPPAPLPAPTVSSAPGASGFQGADVTFQVSGTNFVAGVDVILGPDVFVHSTTLVNPTTLTVLASIFNTAPDGAIDIVVRNRDGQTATLAGGFQVQPTLRHYYSPAGTNVFPYVTATTAATSLAAAMGAAANGDTILIPTMTLPSFSLNVTKNITIQGAWNGTFTARNLVSGKTVLQLDGIIDIVPGVNGAALDGFILEGGDGRFDIFPTTGYFAGAIRILNASAKITHCEIRTSAAGAAMNLSRGGAIYAYQSTVDIRNNSIHDNIATRGGGAYLDQCSGQLSNNTISNNQVVTTGVDQPDGSGLYLVSCSNMTLAGNTIHHNSGGQNGGGILVENSTNVVVDGGVVSYHMVSFSGGGVAFKSTSGTIQNVTVKRNVALLSGGISVGTAPNATVKDCRIEWNVGTFGGGMGADGTSLTITHNRFVGNSSTTFTGALAVSGPTAGAISGNTLDRNTVGSGTGGMSLASTQIEVFNNIVANSTGVGIACTGSAPTLLAYNDVVNASGGLYSGCVAGTGSISSTPMFADTSTGGYHLAVHSPCIDAGRPDAPYNDPDGSRGDMGVHGSHAFTMDQPAYVQGANVTGVGGSGGNLVLRWKRSQAPDLAKYGVYASTTTGFVPASANFVSFVNAPDTFVTVGTAPSAGTTYYRVNAVDATGFAGGYSAEATLTPATPVDPIVYANRLHPNVPNPFNPATEIRFELESASDVSLVIYDIGGRVVRTLVRGPRGAGEHAARWDGLNERGDHVASGVYFYRLDAEGFSQTRKMTLLK